MAFVNATCAEGNHKQSLSSLLKPFSGDPFDPPLPATTASPGEQAQVLRHRPLCANLLCNPVTNSFTFLLSSQPSCTSRAKCLSHDAFETVLFRLLEHCQGPPMATARLPLVRGQHVQGSTAGPTPSARFLTAHR